MRQYCYVWMCREEGPAVPTVPGSTLLLISVLRELIEMSSDWSKILLLAIRQQSRVQTSAAVAVGEVFVAVKGPLQWSLKKMHYLGHAIRISYLGVGN